MPLDGSDVAFDGSDVVPLEGPDVVIAVPAVVDVIALGLNGVIVAQAILCVLEFVTITRRPIMLVTSKPVGTSRVP